MTSVERRPALFVTGTDTGTGKTIVTAGLVRLARKNGLRALAVKPVETGCLSRDGILCPEDGTLLREASENELSLEECCPFRFSLPASPARAAAAEGRALLLSDLEQHVRKLADRADILIVEGAGGLMVPIQGRLMMIDLVEKLGFPALVVARTRLGTINHTLLSVEALRQRSIRIAGIVLSATEPETGAEEQHTPSDMAQLLDGIPLLVLSHLDSAIRSDAGKIAEAMETSWDKQVWGRWIGLAD